MVAAMPRQSLLWLKFLQNDLMQNNGKKVKGKYLKSVDKKLYVSSRRKYSASRAIIFLDSTHESKYYENALDYYDPAKQGSLSRHEAYKKGASDKPSLQES